MKNKTKILTICLLIFSVLFSPIAIANVSASPAQTQAEKQKAQRQKEAEKKRKAAEKQKAQRQKEQAKRQQEKAKADAQRKKEQARAESASQTNKQQAKTAAATDSRNASIIDATDAYERRVAEIEAQNKKIIERSRRDLTHAIGVWGMMGYSAMFQNIKENAEAAPGNIGFTAKTLGGFGGGVGLGYQLKYNNFLFNTGFEFEMYNSNTKIYSPSESDDMLVRYYPVAEYPTMSYKYEFEMRDKWQGGFVQLPVLFGGEWDRWYFLVGPKVGIGVMGKSQVSSVLSTSVHDIELPDIMIDMPGHNVVTALDMGEKQQSLSYSFNLGLAAEAGLYLDEWLQPKPKKTKGAHKQNDNFFSHIRYRLSIYADYGLLSVQSKNNLASGAIDIPAVLPGNPDPLVFPVTSALSTTYAADKRVNPFLVGVKLAIFYQFPKKQEKLIPIPAQPMPLFRAKVVDEETGEPVQGAMLSLYNVQKDKYSNKATSKEGVVLQRMPKAEYAISVKRAGYEPSDTISYLLSKDMSDTLYISIKAEEIPTIYYLTAFVKDAETMSPLAARVSITDDIGSAQLYDGEATEDGLLVTDLTAGTYNAHLTYPGYMPSDEVLAFEQDTLTILMQRIREGKKVVLHNLFFATNKTQILPESEAALEELAGFLTDNPTVEIRITGHTDAVGSDAANQRLSEGRAKAVREDLIMRGVNAERITSEGKGESEPIADNETEEGRALNRRVEFTITATGGEDIKQVTE